MSATDAASAGLRLYHHGSSVCAAKVRFALAEKALPWDGRYVDILAGEQFRPEFLAVNPKAVVPVLVHEGVVVPESTVICEYLEDAFPAHAIYPEMPAERAAVRLWTKAVDEELHPACSALTYVVSHRHTILRRGAGAYEAFLAGGPSEGRAARERKWAWIEKGMAAPGAADQARLFASCLERMDAALDGRAWLVGDSLTMADIALAPYVNRLALLSLDALWRGGRLPNVERWFGALADRAAFRAAVEDWLPEDLAAEMRANGEKSRPEVLAVLGVTPAPAPGRLR